MRNISIIMLLFWFGLGNAQAIRIYYSLDYKIRTSAPERKQVLDILTIKDGVSVFENWKSFQKDSMFISSRELLGVEDNESFTRSMFNKMENYKIVKSNPSEALIYKEHINGIETYTYKESPKMEWKFYTDTMKIEGYECKKATTSFGARDWVAWFSEEIPIADGPYKFRNLPGLILKIYDTQQEYVWTMVGIKHHHKLMLYPNNMMEVQEFAGINITKEQYKRIREQLIKSPMKNMRNHFVVNEDGGSSKEEVEALLRQLADTEKKIIAWLSEHNNEIERQ